MQRKLLVGLGLFLLFIVTFVVAAFALFPMDTVRHLAEKKIEAAVKTQSVSIEKLSVGPTANVTLKNVSLTPRNSEPLASNLATTEGTFNGYFCPSAVNPMPFTIDEIFVNPKLASVIKNVPKGSFSIKVSGGTIEGMLESRIPNSAKSEDDAADESASAKNNDAEDNADAKTNSKSKNSNRKNNRNQNAKNNTPKKSNVPDMIVTAKGERIGLDTLTILGNMTKAMIYGEVDFDLFVVLENSQLSKLTVTFNSLATALCPKRIEINKGGIPYLELPFTMFGDIEGDIELEDNRIKINTLKTSGPDIKLNATGSIKMNPRNKQTNLDLSLTIAPSSEWMENNSMDVLYQVCRRQDDGSIEMTLTGNMKKPNMDCGTPIPVEKPVKAAEAESKPAEVAKPEKEKPAEVAKPEKEKPEADPAPAETEKKTEGEIKRIERPSDELMEGSRRVDRPSGSRRAGREMPADGEMRRERGGSNGGPGRGARRPRFENAGEGGPEISPRMRERLNNIDETIERDMTARRRGSLDAPRLRNRNEE